MAASYEANHVDSYKYTDDPFSSPEEVKITSQPQPQEAEASKLLTTNSSCLHKRLIACSFVRHLGRGHEAARSQDCGQCGQEVAEILCTQLMVGGSATHDPFVAPLRFSDVMVLTHDQDLSDVSGIVQGLRDASLPVRVVRKDEAEILTQNFEGNEILVAWRGLARSGAARRVLVLLPPRKSDCKMWLIDFKSFGAAHIIWVGPFVCDNDVSNDDNTLDVLLDSEDSWHGYSPLEIDTTQNYSSSDQYNNNNNNNNDDDSDKKGAEPASSSGPNDCCDNFCLNCYIDVGDSGSICCCPCCGEIGTACENCCRSFGDCLSAFFCGCCDDSSGNGCGDCDCDCGDCDCDCGDCNCDCGNCDCVIM